MTEVNLNETVNGYRGSIGRLVFKRYKGRTIVGRKPVVTKAPTNGQIAHRERFKAAVAFAKSAVADPALSAFYAPIAQQREITVYVVAVGDFLKTPEFQYVDLEKYKGRIGDPIVIKAVDDIGLAFVDVKLVSQQGTLIESGSAIETGTGSGMWTYTAKTPVALGTDIFIEANGADHAGNKVKITENPTVGEVE
jgi:hypothetical protein